MYHIFLNFSILCLVAMLEAIPLCIHVHLMYLVLFFLYFFLLIMEHYYNQIFQHHIVLADLFVIKYFALGTFHLYYLIWLFPYLFVIISLKFLLSLFIIVYFICFLPFGHWSLYWCYFFAFLLCIFFY